MLSSVLRRRLLVGQSLGNCQLNTLKQWQDPAASRGSIPTGNSAVLHASMIGFLYCGEVKGEVNAP